MLLLILGFMAVIFLAGALVVLATLFNDLKERRKYDPRCYPNPEADAVFFDGDDKLH